MKHKSIVINMKNSTYSQLKNLLNEIVIVINSKRIILDVNKFFMSFIDCYDISSVVNTKIDLFLDDEGSKKIREFIINRKDKLTYNKATITLTLNLLGKPVNIRMYRKIINKDNDEIVLLSVNCEKRL